jgi:hypothetical protein
MPTGARTISINVQCRWSHSICLNRYHLIVALAPDSIQSVYVPVYMSETVFLYDTASRKISVPDSVLSTCTTPPSAQGLRTIKASTCLFRQNANYIAVSGPDDGAIYSCQASNCNLWSESRLAQENSHELIPAFDTTTFPSKQYDSVSKGPRCYILFVVRFTISIHRRRKASVGTSLLIWLINWKGQ